MANQTIYPYGIGGSLPEGYPIVNDLVSGGADKSLSAAMGMQIGGELYKDLFTAIDLSSVSLTNIYINAQGEWNASAGIYAGKFVDISQYRGMSFKIGNFKKANGYWFYRFSFLTSDSHTPGATPNWSSVSPFTQQITISSNDPAQQWFTGVVPNDASFIFVYCHYSDSDWQSLYGVQDFPPDLIFIRPNPQSRIGQIEEDIEGIADIKDGWFAKADELTEVPLGVDDCWKKQTIGGDGTTYIDNDAPAMCCFPKSASKSAAAASAADCYSVADLPGRVLTLKFSNLESGYWRANAVLYTKGMAFVKRYSYLNADTSDTLTFDFNDAPTAAYFKVIIIKRDAQGNDLEATYSFDSDFCTMLTGALAQASMPDRVATLENAQVGGIRKFSICSYNIGHFSLGKDYDTWVSDSHDDLDYDNYTYNRSTGQGTPPYANYAKQRERWRHMLNEYSPDVLMMCEYCATFAHNTGGDVAADTEIFGQYPYKRIGSLPSATSYMRTAVFSRIPLGVASETVYPHTVQAGRYYQQMDIELCGKTVTLVVTHLDFNQGNNGATYRAEQMQALISAFSSKDYVIICGDFNCTSTEYDVFTNAGFDMANHNGYLGNIWTCPSTGSETWGSTIVHDAQPNAAIDNIITKGFAISNIRVADRKDLSDHMAIMCDLTLID